MRFFATALMLAGIASANVLPAANAQTSDGQTRCALLGPLVISGYLELFQQVAQKKRDQVGIRASQVVSLMELYDRLGCGSKELIAAIECLSATTVDKNNSASISQRAQDCMKQSGMPVR